MAVDNEKILKNMNNLVDLNLKEINEKIKNGILTLNTNKDNNDNENDINNNNNIDSIDETDNNDVDVD